ncbi:hypothetical protein V9K67_25780 [Paraflavisolibacter sp. H34]|uniref:hypothetical protein n=1 Tax=Huijunlia imazamoxiresistens TaxID=3127457 RepID=UPI003017689D
MMHLEIYLDGQLLDAVPLSLPLPQDKNYDYSKIFKSLISELEKKHARLLSRSAVKPTYCVSGIPSSINSFVPLGIPVSPPVSGVRELVPPTAVEPAPATSVPPDAAERGHPES